MTQVKDLLRQRSEGWESDADEAGEGLYYTEKQTRVFKAIMQNWEADLSEVADKANVHPSYVRYIVNRLPKDKATDKEWLMQKAGLDEEDLEEDLEEDDGATQEPDGMMQSFGVGAKKAEQQQVVEGDSREVSMTTMLPVTITVQIPGEALDGDSLTLTDSGQAKAQE